MTNTPDKEREHKLRERAYALWEKEGRPAGRHEQHWHDASRELDDDHASQSPEATVEKPAAEQSVPKARRGRPAKKVDPAIAPTPDLPESDVAAPEDQPATADVSEPAAASTPEPVVKRPRTPRVIKPKKA